METNNFRVYPHVSVGGSRLSDRAGIVFLNILFTPHFPDHLVGLKWTQLSRQEKGNLKSEDLLVFLR